MYLIIEDIATDTTVVKIPVAEVIDEYAAYWTVAFDSPVYHNFSFQIDCALYGLNEGQVEFDTIEDDEGKPYVRWFILQDLVEIDDAEDNIGFVAKFIDKLDTEHEYIAYDQHYANKEEMEASLADYIKNDLFLPSVTMELTN
jgi:hypothetical protein